MQDLPATAPDRPLRLSRSLLDPAGLRSVTFWRTQVLPFGSEDDAWLTYERPFGVATVLGPVDVGQRLRVTSNRKGT